MRTNLHDRGCRYHIEDGCLVRTVTSDAGDGRGYTHRCELKVYETVAHAIAEMPLQGDGTTLSLIARQEHLPYTQVNVAIEFLKERGIIIVRQRRCHPASEGAHLDAMVEWHALAHAAKHP